MELNQANQVRQIDHLELSEAVYNQVLAHLSNTPYKYAQPIIQIMTGATKVVFQDELGRPNPDGAGVPRGRVADKPEEEPEEEPDPVTGPEREHVPIMTLQECADAEQADEPADGADDENVEKSGAGGAQ